MVVSSVLAAGVLVLLLYGRVPLWPLLGLCIALAMVLVLLQKRKGHRHSGALPTDLLAQRSRLLGWNTGLKVCASVGILVLCVAADSFAVAAAVLALMTTVNLATSRVGLAGYLALLALPGTFLALSGLVLLVEVSPTPLGLLDIPAFGRYFSVTTATQAGTALVLAKALGAVSCLYTFSLSTPVYEITSFLRRVHVPAIVVELMVLMYRYIFVLLACLHSMQTAAGARLGYRTCRAGLRSSLGIAANLLARSFARASRSFDAMEARGYDGEIRFLEHTKPLRAKQALCAAGAAALPVAALLVERGVV